MPNLANAKKALRQDRKKAARNQIIRDEIRSSRRHFRKALEGKKLEEAKKMIPTLDKMLDKSVTKNILKKNTASRIKSRLAAALKRASVK